MTLLAGLLTFQSGVAGHTDERLRVARDALITRPASDKIHILEIDAKSIASIDSWPWPRRVHAEVVDKLAAAGVMTIAFDVDFSSSSNADDDRIFAGALSRFDGTLILPTFLQKSSSTDSSLIENLPIEQLRAHAFMASVNVQPDSDGTIRNISYGITTDRVARPTMAAMLAQASGDIDRSFRIDTSIDPASLPRHSVSDLLAGKIKAGSLSGKSVFIGATAIELGDRYTMSRHGVQPGVIIQALAAETLIARPDFITLPESLSILVAIGFAIVMTGCRKIRSASITSSAGLLTLLILPFGLEYHSWATLNVGTGLYMIGSSFAVLLTAHILGRFNSIRMTDAATGLGNERSMALSLASNDDHHAIAVHIDNFNDIVAVLGDDRSVDLLHTIAERLKLGSGQSMVYRIGKGKLGLASSMTNAREITEMINGLQALLTGKLTIGASDVTLNVFFGVAPVPEDNPAIALNNANVAAHQASLSGAKWAIFNDAMNDRSGYVQKILSGLDEAIGSNDIYLLYQPKWSLTEHRVTGVEALVRWNHATLGPISPGDFIPVLEQNNQIHRLTLHIAEKCGSLAREWLLSKRDASIAMNISAPLLMDPAFTALLNKVMVDIGPARKLLCLEITESAAVTDAKEIIATLQNLRKKGIKISIDDYGTGQSTLSYLQKFPADEIKIDQSFVSNLLHSKSDQILVRSTIELGHELGLTVIAEGVEDAATMALLKSFGCDMIQGWHIGRAMPFYEVEAMIDENAYSSPNTASGG